MGGSIPEELFERVSAPVLERIRNDVDRFEVPVRDFVAYVGEHLFSPDLTIKSALAAVRMHGNSARDRFRFAIGLSPAAYVLECRMEIALRLLQLLPADVSVHRIALALGYQEKSFHAAFRRFFGATAHQTRLRMQAHPELLQMSPALLRRETLERASWGRLTEAEHAALRRVLRALGARLWETGEEAVDEDEEAFGERFFDEVMAERLARVSPIEQRELIRNGFPFKSIVLPRALMRWSREGCRDDRAEGVRVAALALDSVWALRVELGPAEFSHLLAEAYANLGNARRLVFDFEGAELAFSNAEAELATQPAPPELEAEILWLKGTLRQFQRRFSEAREMLDRSLTKAVEPMARARVLLTRGMIHELLGDDGPAESDCLEALQVLEGSTGHYLCISGHACLSVLFTRKGQHGRAQAELEKARQLAPAVGSQRVSCHLSWVEGILSHSRGQWALAERWLLEAREGFSVLDDRVFAAMVGLDLALLFCEKARMLEVEQLMAEALPLFERLRFDAEGVAALRLLQRAAARRRITAALLERVRSHFEMAGMVPRRP